MQTTIYQKLRDAVRDFMRTPGTFGPKLRARVFVEEIEPEICRLFLFETAERLMRAEERAAVRDAEESQRKDDAQMKLLGPGFAELFPSVRYKLPLKTGKKVMDLMTRPQLRESAAELRREAKTRVDKFAAQNERRAQYLEGLAEAMRPYSVTRRNFTFRDYCELRAAGVEANAPAKTPRGAEA